jgi:O-acetyl-ADP-ribose deacetylase (regulator of RNase III)
VAGRVGRGARSASCYRRSLEAADRVGASGVSFPAISTGAYAYPPASAAEIAVTTVTTTPTAVGLVRFVCFDDATAVVYRRLLTPD